ncbi:hypothetical protein HYH02_008575 [Chlamydomonas schloesseri]|uniref:Uncharacterized protein n=1 Tax=Chlamydomonas schloesseri TaxID=2026947 RepID=A0A835WFP7_9CHLO|nr:hypothetical protein HYH02_008575 [Chlamydomonas schloesseri]|eukprot:KAG2446590.1 hypothetical protein HYH02_008575 [Chlamydomonas schloesseri]
MPDPLLQAQHQRGAASGKMLVSAAEGAAAQRAAADAGFTDFSARCGHSLNGAAAAGTDVPIAAAAAGGEPGVSGAAGEGIRCSGAKPHGSSCGPAQQVGRPPAPHGAEGIGAMLPSRIPGAAEAAVYGGVDPGGHATDARELSARAPVLE